MSIWKNNHIFRHQDHKKSPKFQFNPIGKHGVGQGQWHRSRMTYIKLQKAKNVQWPIASEWASAPDKEGRFFFTWCFRRYQTNLSLDFFRTFCYLPKNERRIFWKKEIENQFESFQLGGVRRKRNNQPGLNRVCSPPPPKKKLFAVQAGK